MSSSTPEPPAAPVGTGGQDGAGGVGPDPPAQPVIERERKFSVAADFHLPVPSAPGVSLRPLGLQQLVATYFDTPEHRLARDAITLRRRTGEPGAPWTLKLPVGPPGGGGRKEHHAHDPAPGRVVTTETTVPPRLLEMLTPWTGTAPLTPVAVLSTVRDRYELRAGGRVVAEVVDDTVRAQPAGGPATAFREVEVEQRTDDPAVLAGLAADLLAAGAVEGPFTAKLVRALGPTPEPAGLLAAPEPLRPREQVAAFLAVLVRDGARRLALAHLGVRAGSPDAIHQARVACRRLRSNLRAFAPLLSSTPETPLRAELAWLAGELGAARDLEVLAAGLPASTNGDAGDPLDTRVLIRIHAELARAQTAAHVQATAALESDRYARIWDLLHTWLSQPPGAATDASWGRSAGPLVGAAWARVVRRADRLDARTPSPQVHEVRIAAKRARYAAELVETAAAVHNRAEGAVAVAAREVQEILGRHQDAVMAARTLASYLEAGSWTAPEAFTLGRLAERQWAIAAETRRSFLARWPTLRRCGPAPRSAPGRRRPGRR